MKLDNSPSSEVAAATSSESSYGQIFKSTAVTGGASAISLLLGIVRTKVMAVLLGPAGVGLAGIYTTIIGLTGTLAGMGIGNSGVRRIAEVAGTGDQLRIARTVWTLRRTALVLGLAGAFLLAVVSRPASVLSFGDESQAGALAVLGLAVFFGAISSGQTALIQGLRRIADLAWLNVLGALAGTVLGLPLIWWLGIEGIVPLLVVVSAASLACSWWFARRLPMAAVRLSCRETADEVRDLLGLGLAFMASALMTTAVAWITRLLVVRHLGLEAAGHYTAAYTLSGIYAGFILQAMGADFFPRLTAVADDLGTLNRLVNEQTEIALLMAVPGVLATLVLAPWVIHLFYAGGFDPAAEVLRWQVIGILGRVVSWPMGFIQLARGRRGTFLATEVFSNAAHVGFIWWGINRFGLKGTGMAFAGLYVFYTGLMLVVTGNQTGFRWSPVNRRILLGALPAMALVFLVQHQLPGSVAFVFGLSVTIVVGWLCLCDLVRRVPEHQLGKLRWRLTSRVRSRGR